MLTYPFNEMSEMSESGKISEQESSSSAFFKFFAFFFTGDDRGLTGEIDTEALRLFPVFLAEDNGVDEIVFAFSGLLLPCPLASPLELFLQQIQLK